MRARRPRRKSAAFARRQEPSHRAHGGHGAWSAATVARRAPSSDRALARPGRAARAAVPAAAGTGAAVARVGHKDFRETARRGIEDHAPTPLRADLSGREPGVGDGTVARIRASPSRAAAVSINAPGLRAARPVRPSLRRTARRDAEGRAAPTVAFVEGRRPFRPDGRAATLRASLPRDAPVTAITGPGAPTAQIRSPAPPDGIPERRLAADDAGIDPPPAPAP